MMIDIEMTIEGLDELDKALENYSDKIAKKALNSALSAGALPILKEAKRLASQADHAHTMRDSYSGSNVKVEPGLLKSAIRRRRLKARELKKINAQAGVAVYVGKGSKQKLYAKYWYFLEFGTSKLAPIPYLRPAWDGQKQNAVMLFKEKLAQNIDKLNELE